MTIFLLLRLLFGVCLLATATIGWRYGGRAERGGVAIVVIGSAVSWAVMELPIFDWRTHRAPLVVIDLIAFVALLVLALRSDRFWPIWAAAFHLITLGSHAAIPLLPRPLLQAYAIFQGFWIYPVMACILIGTHHHHHHRATPRPADDRPPPR